MKRFAVAYISYFDNVQHIKIVEVETAVQACEVFLDDHGLDTLEAVEQFAFDCDSAITALEIPETGTAERVA